MKKMKEKIRKMSKEEKREIREDMLNGLSISEIEKKYNINYLGIHYILQEYLQKFEGENEK